MKSTDIPQADSLDQVRKVVQAVYDGASSTQLCHEMTGISPRHVGYALHAARTLGWIDMRGRSFTTTTSGDDLLLTSPRSTEEIVVFTAAIRSCRAIQRVAPDLLGDHTPLVDEMTENIARLADLANGTARRRVQTLLYWRQRVASPFNDGDRARRRSRQIAPPAAPLSGPTRATAPASASASTSAPAHLITPPHATAPASGPPFDATSPTVPPSLASSPAPASLASPPPPSHAPPAHDEREVAPGGLRLEAMQIERYGSIHTASATLSPFVVLIGGNTSGKSTFMDSLSFLSEALSDGVGAAVSRRASKLEDLLWYGKGESFVLSFEFAIPAPLRCEPRLCRARYELEVGRIAAGGVGVRFEGLMLRPMGSAPDYIPMVETPQGWRRVLSRTDKAMASCQAERSGWKTALSVGPQQLALAALPEDPRRFPVVSALRLLVRERVRRLQLNPQAMKGPCSPLRPAGLVPDGSNLPLVVQRLRDRAPDRFAEWREQLRVALPEIESIRVIEREEDRHLYLKLHYLGGLALPSWRLSEGTLRILALTLIPFAAENEEIYLIEEPENGIHPQAVRAVYENLAQPFGIQIMLATHSPVIFGIIQPDQILCFTREAGGTRIIPGQEHPLLYSRQQKAQRSMMSRGPGGVPTPMPH